MGLFKTKIEEKTELEKFIEILSTTQLENDEVKESILTYVRDIKNKKISNPFKDEKTLVSVLIKYSDKDISKKENIIDFISQVKNVLDTIYIIGNYDEELDLILNIFNNNGIYENNLFDINFYRLFDNVLEYLTVMNMFLENNIIRENFDKIIGFLINIRSTYENGDKFYFYTLAFLNKITYGTDLEKLINDEKVRIDKKEGIYDLDETTLDLIYSKVLSSEGFLTELERLVGKADKLSKNLSKSLEEYKTKLREINLDSLKEYKTTLQEDLDKLKVRIEETREELDKYTITKREEIASSLAKEQTSIISSLVNERDRIISSLKKFEETLTSLALAKSWK